MNLTEPQLDALLTAVQRALTVARGEEREAYADLFALLQLYRSEIRVDALMGESGRRW